MRIHDATEIAYNNGYDEGFKAGRKKGRSEVARDIIADMRELINGYENIDVYLDRIEKKYTEGGK